MPKQGSATLQASRYGLPKRLAVFSGTDTVAASWRRSDLSVGIPKMTTYPRLPSSKASFSILQPNFDSRLLPFSYSLWLILPVNLPLEALYKIFTGIQYYEASTPHESYRRNRHIYLSRLLVLSSTSLPSATRGATKASTFNRWAD